MSTYSKTVLTCQSEMFICISSLLLMLFYFLNVHLLDHLFDSNLLLLGTPVDIRQNVDQDSMACKWAAFNIHSFEC